MFPIGTDRALARPTLVNHLLLLSCALVFVVQQLLETIAPGQGRGGGGATASFVTGLWLDPGRLTWYGFFTYQFLHGGMMHLLGNMLFLWVFGPNVEDRLGRAGYLAFYLLGGVAAGATHVFLASTPAPVIGASGSISAVTGAYLVLFPRTHVRVFLMFIIIGMFNIPAVWFIGFAMAKDLFMQGLGGNDGVARLAHIGGYVFGGGVSLALLAAGVLPREAFDLFSLGKQAHRRRRFREMTGRGGDPWSNTGRVRADARPRKLSAREQARLAARSKVTGALASGLGAEAARLHLAMLEEFPEESLSPAAQRDIANQLFAMGEYERSAQAYGKYLEKYEAESDAPSMGLMLALVLARYLHRPARAGAALEQVRERLTKADERSMAETLLEEIHAATAGEG
jgi:membrane associated rhomboid family serine protease